MKIMFLIPVTADFEEKKRDINIYLKKYIRPDTDLIFRQIAKGFPSVESDLQGMFNGCQVVKEAAQAGECFDGVYVNCFDDPGVYACREMADTNRVTAVCLGCTAMFYVVDALRKRLQQAKISVTIIEPMANSVSFLERMIQQKLVNYVPMDTAISLRGSVSLY